MVFFKLGVPTKLLWNCRVMKMEVLVHITVAYTCFGRSCGKFKYLTRLDILCGEQLMIYCL